MKFTTFDIFQALMLILDIHFVYSFTISVPKRVGLLGRNNVSIECVYFVSDEDELSGIGWSRKRSSERNFVDIAGKDVKKGWMGYVDGEGTLLQNRTVLKFGSGKFIIIYMEIRREDEATYRCTVNYFVNGSFHNKTGEMLFEVKVPCNLKCENYGSPNDVCDKCNCVGNWKGSICRECGLTCLNGGTPLATCSGCVCRSGFEGAICGESGKYKYNIVLLFINKE
ncbi:uncharacterized protein LOC121373304 isoform X2 [Gigantopelta aegis]|nr:uncharacterized protein LOC121373304 isoform X2 [Gigantopelta aegis]XP_041355794.1 uncharacterized protein LOC121373304 isoform X2 [Gigantopelta aegis]